MGKRRESRTYDRLDADSLTNTLEGVRKQIEAAFPGSGLSRVATSLIEVCETVRKGAADVRRPYIGLRAIIVAAMAASVGVAWLILGATKVSTEINGDALDLLQGLEALFNAVFLLLAGLVFITSVEERLKRAKALRALHQVRSIAHVIDMHQLSKDPPKLAGDARFSDAAALVQYLQHCTDLLSLTGKIGALYAQDMGDPVVIETVNDIETLTTNLARKIWQKVLIIQSAGLAAAS